MDKLCKSKQLTFKSLPLELREAILVAGGKNNHHLFMSVCRDWYNILCKYRERNNMPFIRQTGFKAFSYLNTLGYTVWCLQNNLQSRHILRPLVKRDDLFDILQWYAKTYKKMMHIDTECVHKWLGDDYQTILEAAIYQDKIEIFKWIYEQNKEKNQYLYLRPLKKAIVVGKCINILRYLCNNCSLFDFGRDEIKLCVYYNFFGGLKLLHREEYKCDVSIINSSRHMYAPNGDSIEILRWLVSNGYVSDNRPSLLTVIEGEGSLLDWS